jgi:peptidoglycan/LPS O-acetylase OafA/YrhL
MRLARIGWVVVILGAVAIAYALGQPAREVDGRVYGPDVTIAALLFGLGASLVSAVGQPPLDTRLARVGMALLAVGAFAVAAIKPAESSGNPMAGLTPVVVAFVALVSGALAVAVSLVRSRGRGERAPS